MARLSKASVHAALDRAADNILKAGGPDGIVSRRDMRQALSQYTGVEKQLISIFYRFMDHRDAAKGARITKKDVDEAVAYAKEHMIDAYDLNQNGLSKDEIAKMSLTGRLAVAFARLLKRSSLKEDDMSSEALAKLLGGLAEGLFFDDFGSEASESLTPVFFDTQAQTLTPETFAQAANLDLTDPAQAIARFIPAGDFFERFVDTQFESNQRQANDLVEVMRANLSDIHVIIVGLDQDGVDPAHPAYWVGLTYNGDIVGLQSLVIWT